MSSCCKTHVKRINPVTGVAVVYDVSDGSVVTDPLILADLECCPIRTSEREEICFQALGNVDPAAIESGWLVTVEEVNAAGELEVLQASIYDKGLTTNYGTPGTTHEVVDCLDQTPIDIDLCLGS